MKNIVFLSYGSRTLHHGVIFCLYTLHHHLKGDFKDLRIIIYTDDAALFNKYLKDFPVIIETLTPEKIQEYRKPYGYIHRVKTCVMKECLEKYQSDIVFLDSDVFFLKNPWPLFKKINKQVSVMNADEYDLLDGGDFEDDENWLKLRKIIRLNTYLIDGENKKIPLTTRMWNSGITGLSYENTHLMEKVLHLIDQIYGKNPIFHAEQYALAYVLQNTGTIVSTEDYFVHYYIKLKERKVFEYYVDQFFKENRNKPISEQIEKAYALSQQYEALKETLPKHVSLYDRTKLRLKVIRNVIVKGRLN